MEISDKTTVGMPIRNLISIVTAVALGVYAYFGIVETLNQHSTQIRADGKRCGIKYRVSN
jgi:hypothetical protein